MKCNRYKSTAEYYKVDARKLLEIKNPELSHKSNFISNFIVISAKLTFAVLRKISRNSLNSNLPANLYFLVLCVETRGPGSLRRATIPIIPRPLSPSFTLISAQTKPIKVACEFSSQSGWFPLNNTK